MLGKTTSFAVRTPEGVTFEIPIASPFSRGLALLIDVAMIIVLTILIRQLIGALQITFSGLPILGRVLQDFSSGALIVIQFLISIGYGLTLEWLWSGRTLGKRLMKLRVIDERGLALGLRQVVIRNLFRFIDMLPTMLYPIGGIACLLTKRCQRLGDLAAGTLVVREIPYAPPALDEVLRSDRNSFSTLPHLEARLRQHTSAEEARIVLDAILRRDELDPDARLELFSRLADHFRERAEFPDEITLGLSDEQYVRNVAATLFHRATP